MEHRWNEIDRGQPKYWGGGGICHSATLSTTIPIWTDPGSNLDLRGERPAINRLSHGTAENVFLIYTALIFQTLTKESIVTWRLDI
jgi:hypothetical protein